MIAKEGALARPFFCVGLIVPIDGVFDSQSGLSYNARPLNAWVDGSRRQHPVEHKVNAEPEDSHSAESV